MKPIKSIILLAAGALVFAACEDSHGPVLDSNAEAPVISSPSSGTSYVLAEENAEEDLLTLEWSAPDFGFSAAVNYRVELDTQGGDFDSPVNMGNINTTSFTVTVGEMNSRLISAGLPGGLESTVGLRVQATLEDAIDPLYSDPVMLAIAPYQVVIDFPEIYVPGSYQAAGGYTNDWSPEDAPALYSHNSDDHYEGYVYFADSDNFFKFTEERSWDVNWGDDAFDGNLQPDGADIPMADPGYYKINVDLNNMTYATLSTTWGVIGDATPDGWDSDQDMEYDIDDKVWRITLNLNEGELKFRANNDWDLDYGSDNADGTLQEGGGNIPIEAAGSYTVELDLSGPTYQYTLTMN